MGHSDRPNAACTLREGAGSVRRQSWRAQSVRTKGSLQLIDSTPHGWEDAVLRRTFLFGAAVTPAAIDTAAA